MIQRSAAREPTEYAGNADATVKPPLHSLWASLIAIFLPDVAAMQAAFSFVPFRSWMPVGGLAADGSRENRQCRALTGRGTQAVLKNGGIAEGTARRTAIPPDMEAFA